ncbi:NADH-quinone oxidoreductase subunit L [Segetibacter sp. 3557_3]|uniref:NADH-quinone oxidoreductase subunit L n=1 Tax=Segetibacter sp. 3557_3 TaxID=2547429 RepID=UPI001058827B|nr:NADH-quinone oxidoreductase subunit L [Segetibacter sp. 3557_3]TDH25509.1 NADH-quinone oxidoreductase subunit L [Segetibacter sp. 3557_3]
MSQLAYLIPLFPLIGFLINGLGRNKLSKSLISIIGCGTILASFIVSLLIFFEVKQPGFRAVTVHLFDFIRVPAFNIPFDFQIDQLSSLFLLIITGVGFLIHVYSSAYMKEEAPQHYGRYFAYLNLFVFSMLLLVLGANYVIMFIGWEGVGLCSYLLIGYWFKNNEYNYAARKAFVMNRIGDLGFLLAVFWILQKLGTSTYSEVFANAANFSTAEVTGITMLLFVGAMGKSAQIPLYTWLPDAMAGPTPVSALIHAATMVTAGIYMIVRSNVLYSMAPGTLGFITIIGLVTALLAATIAIKQNDIKKVLAYSTVSQLGYMFLGLGVGAYTGAVFHVMTHAFFKALLFLGAGSVIHAVHNQQDIRYMGGLKKHMPITHITFLLACLAISGIPPFSGFFSKDEILAAAYAHNPVLWIVGVITAALTAFYMFRLYAMTFLGTFRGTHDQEHHLHESPSAMTIPLIVLAVLSVIGGFVGIPEVFAPNAHALANFLSPVIVAPAESHHLSHATEYMLMGVSVGLAAIAIFYAWTRFSKRPEIADATGAGKMLANKWYIDELYDAAIARPLVAFGGFLNRFVEKSGIDAVVNGVGKGVQYTSNKIRLLQSGQVGNYILMMVLSMVLMILLIFYGHNLTPILNKVFK